MVPAGGGIDSALRGVVPAVEVREEGQVEDAAVKGEAEEGQEEEQEPERQEEEEEEFQVVEALVEVAG